MGESSKLKRGDDLLANMKASNIFDFMGILLDKAVMAEHDFTVNVTLKDTGEKFMLRFKNAALLQFEDTLNEGADLSINTSRTVLFLILEKKLEEFSNLAKIEGDGALLELIVENLNQFDTGADGPFNIVEP
ncbi:MAG: alkyl sulfatase C-terminal domain-containing protein [Euryarchaeota archaeon]|nr:alkyl sulfatase C-terminal domain-containing protein [Euryarchaeota archaeon]